MQADKLWKSIALACLGTILGACGQGDFQSSSTPPSSATPPPDSHAGPFVDGGTSSDVVSTPPPEDGPTLDGAVSAPDTGVQPMNLAPIGSFGSVGHGGNDTGVFNTAMSGAVSQGSVLEITPGTYNLGPIIPPSNLKMQLDAGVCINLSGSTSADQVWLDLSNSNITITGAGGAAACNSSSSVFMATAGYDQSKSDGSQYRHCLRVSGSHVDVSGIGCDNSGGDGVYIVNPANTVTIDSCVFDHNIRNGGTGISGQHVTINGSTFSNQTDFSSSGIADGIDFEPNGTSDLLIDWNLASDTMTGNGYDGVGWSLYSLTDASKQISMSLTGIASNNNDRYGFFVSNSGTTNSGGTITCSGCSGDNNGNENVIARFWESTGATLTFSAFTSTNNNRLGGDVYGIIAGVAIGGGGGSAYATGNAHFFSTNVSKVNGGHYFDFGDNSGHGLVNVDFTGGTLSGGVAGCNGLVSGTCEASAHIP